jgi:hypothetical protein
MLEAGLLIRAELAGFIGPITMLCALFMLESFTPLSSEDLSSKHGG